MQKRALRTLAVGLLTAALASGLWTPTRLEAVRAQEPAPPAPPEEELPAPAVDESAPESAEERSPRLIGEAEALAAGGMASAAEVKELSRLMRELKEALEKKAELLETGGPTEEVDAPVESTADKLEALSAGVAAGIAQLLPESEQNALFAQVVGEATNVQSSSHVGGMNVLFADGSVRFVSVSLSLQNYEVGGLRVLDWFWRETAQELKLGARREDWKALPGVTVRPVAFEAPGLFSYAGLASATRLLVDSPELERRMLHSLRLAEAAEARGQQAVQDRYMDQYSTLALQGRSRSFFVLDRTHLAGMARAIKESEAPVP